MKTHVFVKAKMLLKWLEKKYWEGMLDPESSLFEPSLLALVQRKKKNQKKPKVNPPVGRCKTAL